MRKKRIILNDINKLYIPYSLDAHSSDDQRLNHKFMRSTPAKDVNYFIALILSHLDFTALGILRGAKCL